MSKAIRGSAVLLLGLVLATGAAFAQDLELALPESEAALAAVCSAPSPAPAAGAADGAQAVATLELFLPEPQTAAICPEIGCVNEQYCRRDRDCTAAPGGVCTLFCPTMGCCAYP